MSAVKTSSETPRWVSLARWTSGIRILRRIGSGGMPSPEPGTLCIRGALLKKLTLALRHCQRGLTLAARCG